MPYVTFFLPFYFLSFFGNFGWFCRNANFAVQGTSLKLASNLLKTYTIGQSDLSEIFYLYPQDKRSQKRKSAELPLQGQMTIVF